MWIAPRMVSIWRAFVTRLGSRPSLGAADALAGRIGAVPFRVDNLGIVYALTIRAGRFSVAGERR